MCVHLLIYFIAAGSPFALSSCQWFVRIHGVFILFQNRTVRRERAQPRAAAPVRPPPAGPAPGRAAGGRAAPAAYPRTRGAGAPTVQAREGALEALVEQHLGVKL